MTSHNHTPSLHTLPIELTYRILDHLRPLDLLLSVRNVCTRLDAITDTYHPYTVKSVFTLRASVRTRVSLHASQSRRVQQYLPMDPAGTDCFRRYFCRGCLLTENHSSGGESQIATYFESTLSEIFKILIWNDSRNWQFSQFLQFLRVWISDYHREMSQNYLLRWGVRWGWGWGWRTRFLIFGYPVRVLVLS